MWRDIEFLGTQNEQNRNTVLTRPVGRILSGGAFQSKMDNGSIAQQNMDDRICVQCSCFESSQSPCISAISLNTLESK